MLIQPKIRGFICTTAHPKGCEAVVKEQFRYVKSKKDKMLGPKNVLVIGASTGYGLASRIVANELGANTIGVFFEKEADEKRTASPGWYNSAAFEQVANEEGRYAKSVNGDAFSQEIKQMTADLIRKDLGKIDLVIYSVASPRRIHPVTQEVYSSVLKPTGSKSFIGKSVDVFRGEIKEVMIEPATEEEINHTVAVMGEDDWQLWMKFLAKEHLLADGVITVAYSYLGPKLTHDIYKDGTIGKAKEHLKQTADKLNQDLQALHGQAVVAVNKAVVTQASAAIPVVPLYISLLFKIMKEKGTHEGCIEQMYRLFSDYLYAAHPSARDEEGYIRLDDLEMAADVQARISELWPEVTTENLNQVTDIEGYREEFYRLFGFHVQGVDYNLDVDTSVKIPSIQ